MSLGIIKLKKEEEELWHKRVCVSGRSHNHKYVHIPNRMSWYNGYLNVVPISVSHTIEATLPVVLGGDLGVYNFSFPLQGPAEDLDLASASHAEREPQRAQPWTLPTFIVARTIPSDQQAWFLSPYSPRPGLRCAIFGSRWDEAYITEQSPSSSTWILSLLWGGQLLWSNA